VERSPDDRKALSESPDPRWFCLVFPGPKRVSKKSRKRQEEKLVRPPGGKSLIHDTPPGLTVSVNNNHHVKLKQVLVAKVDVLIPIPFL
jgi:hypothetical protein